LLPSDVTGVSVFDQRTGAFEFRPGPVFANVLMADEINRATPRTQSAVLEATFPLPEAQLDRFLLRLSLGYPDARDERLMLQRARALATPATDRNTGTPASPGSAGGVSARGETPPATSAQQSLPAVITPEQALALHAACRQVHVEGAVEEYVVAVARATREDADVRLGASPRATLDLYHAAQAWAAMQGRAFVTPDDVKRLA